MTSFQNEDWETPRSQQDSWLSNTDLPGAALEPSNQTGLEQDGNSIQTCAVNLSVTNYPTLPPTRDAPAHGYGSRKRADDHRVSKSSQKKRRATITARRSNNGCLDINITSFDGFNINSPTLRARSRPYVPDSLPFLSLSAALSALAPTALLPTPIPALSSLSVQQSWLVRNATLASSSEQIQVSKAPTSAELLKITTTLKCGLPRCAFGTNTSIARTSGMNEIPDSATCFKFLVYVLTNNLVGYGDGLVSTKSIFNWLSPILKAMVHGESQLLSKIGHLVRANEARLIAMVCFECAIEDGNHEAVKLLLSCQEFGIDVDEYLQLCRHFREKFTPIGRASYLGHIDCVKILIERGADVNKRSSGLDDGPLSHAICREPYTAVSSDLVDSILQAGAIVTSYILDLLLLEYPLLLESVLYSCIDSHHEGWLQKGYFHRLASELEICMVETLFRRMKAIGVDFNSVYYDGKSIDESDSEYEQTFGEPSTLIDIVAMRGSKALIQQLRLYGARLTTDTLSASIHSGKWEAVDCILREGGARNDYSPHFASTPYAMALSTNNTEIIQLLQEQIAIGDLEEGNLSSVLTAVARTNNTKLLETLLKSHNKPDADQLYDALTAAVKAECNAASLLLLEAGAYTESIHAESEDKHLVSIALRNQNAVLVRALIEHDVNLSSEIGLSYDWRYSRERSLLELAVAWGDESIVQDLIFAGTKLPNNREDLIETGIRENSILLARSLMAKGICSRGDFSGCTALVYAVERNDLSLVRELLTYGEDPADAMALKRALRFPDILDLLLHECRRMYPYRRPTFGTAAVCKAIEMERRDLIQLLIINKADLVGSALCERESNPLITAITYHSKLGCDIIRTILDTGVNPDSVVVNGPVVYSRGGTNIKCSRETALIIAIGKQQLEVVELLLLYGADPTLPATRGLKRTPIQKAAETGSVQIIQLLLDYGANVNAAPAVRSGATALQLASMHGHLGAFELLLEYDADITAPGAKVKGRTALAGAAEHGRRDIVYCLLFNAQHSIGDLQTAMKLAKRNKREFVVEILQPALDAAQNSQTQAKQFVCSVCQSHLSNAFALKRHHRTAHGDGEAQTTFDCDSCPRTFSRKDYRDRHEATHDKSKSVTCESCGKTFSRKDYLSEHREKRCKARQQGFDAFQTQTCLASD